MDAGDRATHGAVAEHRVPEGQGFGRVFWVLFVGTKSASPVGARTHRSNWLPPTNLNEHENTLCQYYPDSNILVMRQVLFSLNTKIMNIKTILENTDINYTNTDGVV